MPSLFSRIISGEIPSYKIAEDDDFYAFLDIMPHRAGHTLIVPKVEVDKAFDLPDGFLAKWLLFARPIAKAIEAAIPCERCGMAIIGLEVPHAHLHLIPISSASDMDFSGTKIMATSEELKSAQEKIVAILRPVDS